MVAVFSVYYGEGPSRMMKGARCMDDIRIIELYFARDEEAIRETDKKYGRYCHYIAKNILNNDEDAKEIVNDTYLKAWNTIPPNRPNPLKPYVGTISRNLALDAYDKYHAQKRGGQCELVFEELADFIPDGGADIGESVALSDAISRFLASLPERTRNIFVRRYYYLSPISEIASDYGMKESNIGMHLLRTRKKLEDFLKKEGFTL